jgi:hypothetical protein
MTGSKSVWRGLAVVAAGVFFAIAIRNDVDRLTSPEALSRSLFGPDVVQIAHPWWLALHIWVRKAYSIVAFTIVGLAAHRALGPAKRPILRAAAIVAAFSLAIEIGQRLFTAPEPVLESAFDVACGAVGGWLGVLADRAIRRVGRHPEASRPVRGRLR